MLLPYNVDRATKRTPFVTYTLIGLNIFIFLTTLLVSNTNLPADRSQGRELIYELAKGENIPIPGLTASPGSDGEISEAQMITALVKIKNQIGTPEGYRKAYLIQHVNDKVVLEPHYSVMNLFAYRANDPSPLSKIVGLFTSMFLHGGFVHITGNLLFLWIFGRALEEFLGYKFYAAIYLTCGVAATLLFHIITVTLTPLSAGLPLVGASGAISGVMGLFAIRFYRTKVRVFYITIPILIMIPGIGQLLAVILVTVFLILMLISYLIVWDFVAAIVLATILFAVLMFFIGRTWAWGSFRAPSMWVVAGYILIFNIYPAVKDILQQSQSSTAYWAHLGGFACGALYAFIVGGIDEGKAEYELEDAQTALHKTGSGDALDRSLRILERDPENTPANEVAALAYHQMNNIEAAAPHFIKAIQGFSRQGDRPNAARLYSVASDKNPNLQLPGPILAGLAAEFAKNQDWNASAMLLVRVVEEFPQSAEAELALLRAAQIWMRQYNDPHESVRMLEMFLTTYPASPYLPQVQSALVAAREAARAQMMQAEGS